MARTYKYKKGRFISNNLATKQDLRNIKTSEGSTTIISDDLEKRLQVLESSVGSSTIVQDGISSEELDALNAQMNSMQEQLNSLSTAPSITSFGASGISQINDIGTTLNSVKLVWSIKQNIAKVDSITIQRNSESPIKLDKGATTYTFSDTVNKDTSYALTIYYTYDGKSLSTRKTYGIYFRRPFIYGCAGEWSDGIDSSKVLLLSSRKRASNLEVSGSTFESYFTSNAGQYFYYAIPRELLNRLQLSLNFGLVTVNGGIVLIENDGSVLYKSIDRISDDEYEGIDVTIGTYTTKYALIRSQLDGLGKIYFTSKIK